MAVRKFLTTALFLIALGAAPAPASADWLLTPFIGVNWGGSARFSTFDLDFDEDFENKVDFGASLAWMGAGVIGFEFDVGYSPNFFDTGEEDEDFGDGNLTTLMANLVLGVPIGGQQGLGIRPYASGGVGLIRASLDDPLDIFDVSSNDWGFNVGGGIMGFFTDHVGLRGDVRYFRALQDPEPDDEFDVAVGRFRFWRGTLGVVFRF